MINVFILTFCRNIDLFYGTRLVFDTLRVGFPNAKITVVDNASIPEARTQIESLAKRCDCRFEQLSGKGLQHHDFIEATTYDAAANGTGKEPVVFLDPDICFWDSCEDFHFDGLMAGKLVSRFHCKITQTITMPRLHTSFLWIPDPEKLFKEIRRFSIIHFDFKPFLPYSFFMDGVWYRHDTGASLYAAISDKVSFFTEKHFNHYDHIFCGSHLDWLYTKYDAKSRKMMEKIHGSAKMGDLQSLKGIWKYQDDIFKESFSITNL